MTLLRQQAKQEWLSLLIWGLVTGGLVFYTVVLYQQMGDSLEQMERLVHQMPESMRAIYGGNVSLRTLPGFLQAYAYGPWLWIPFLIYTGFLAVSITTREIDRRTMEFLLSLPVSRWQVVLSRWAGMALALLGLHGMQFLAVLGGVLVIDGEPQVSRYLVAGLNSWLLMLAVGSVMMLVDMFVDDYGRGVGVNLFIGLGAFLYHIGAESATGALKAVRDWLPYAHYDPPRIISAGEVPWGDLGFLAAIAGACLLLSVYLFQRKQISV